jgi:hypothetical protein
MIDHQINEEMILIDQVSDDSLEARHVSAGRITRSSAWS